MVTADLLIQLIAGAGMLSGVAGVLKYLQDRKSIRAEVASQAQAAYQAFVQAQPWPSNSQPRTPLKVEHKCDTPMCPCRGEVYAWCQGCDRTPNVRLMGWTELGLYRCRSCRADGPTETPVLELIDSVADTAAALVPIVATVPLRWPTEPSLEGIFAEFDAFHTERPVECDGRRGNHGDPEVVCAMCAGNDNDAPPHDWGGSVVVRG